LNFEKLNGVVANVVANVANVAAKFF